MAPLEWDKIMKADMENLANDGDTFYEMLKDFDPEKESNADRLKQLFRVCQGVMNVKHDELGEFIIDMESESKKDAETVDKLQKKVKELEIELRNAKKFGHEKESLTSTKYLRETVSELEDQVHQLNKQKNDLQRDLNEEKRANEKYSDQIKKLENYNNELRDEVDQMRQDHSYYKKQLQLHRDNLMTQEEPEYKLKLISKNQELSEAMEELQNLTDNNLELKKNCEILTSKLSEVTKNMEQLTDDYLKRKQINQEQDTVNDRLRTENINMKAQISDLNEKLQTKSESDDAIMVAVSHKVEEWKAAIAEKDEEINTYQKEAMKLRRKLEAIHMDADRASVDALTKVIEAKDKQINELTEEIKNYADEMEINAAVFEDLKKNPSKPEKGPVDYLYKKIQEQQSLLRHKDQELKEANKLVKEADKDTCDKEKQLCETLERIRQYESGEYGLTDAVSEIKELKKQLKIRERKNEELSQLINKSESDMNDVTDENEWLREQLGMDPKRPLDLKDFQSKISVKREEQRALNIVLQKEVERLEEERLMLKQNLRKLAQQTGQRAVALGLSADDMVSIQNYTENLKTSKLNKTASQDAPEMEVLKVTNIELNKDLKNNLHQIKKLSKEKDELQIRYEELKQENQGFQNALIEILDDLKKRNSSDTKETIIECPSLEKIIAALDVRNTGSNSNMLSYANAKADTLHNENEELKKAVQNAKQEAHSAKLEAAEKIQKLEQDILLYQQQRSNQAEVFQPLLLPEGLPSSSAEVIANLNEHLIITLEDMFKKDEHLKETEISLENYQSKMAVIKHQLGLLYSDHLQEKQEYESETKKLKEKLEKLEELRQQDEIQLKEFDRCLDTLSHDDVEVRRRLAEQTRKITVLQINEKALTRRYNSLVEVEGTMRKEISKLKNESIAMEKTVSERFGYLQRFKDTAMFKISVLQKALEESVPSIDLERANKEYQNLTEKYRDLLEKENLFVLKSESVTNLEEDVKKLASENDLLKKVLEMEKDKVHTLEASLENLFQKGVATSEDLHVSDNPQSLAKRMAMVEMKELHERQRAEHAVHMYEKYRTVLRDLERRNTELEENMSKVSQVNLELQKIERDLRDELANSVTKDVSDADRKKITHLEQNEVNLKNEISKLKEISDVATSQVRALEMQQISRDKEVISLQQQLVDFQAQSDEKTVIGKLHRHIVQLQISEGTSIQKLESALQKLSKFESQVLRLEQQIDEKNQTIYHNRTEAQNKNKHLKQNLYDLRRQFAGAVPLSKQETFTRNMVQIREDKLKTEEELLQVQEQRRQMEDKVAELQLIQSSQRELLEATVKDSQTGANKLVEWHSKLEALRLTELKQKRGIVQLEEKINFLEKTNRHQERTIDELERNSVRTSKEFEERQLIWEQRELELELVISRMEKRASDIASVASKFGKAVGNIPDASEPVAVQLEQAISTIKQNMKIISDTQAESQVLKQQTEKLECALREAEKALIEKDKIISEIRLRMPATTDRDSILERATATAIQSHKQDPNCDDAGSGEQAMKVAQCAISSLKARIKLKEESIEKLQDLLKTAHDDMEKMNRNHFEQLQQMQLKIHANTDKSFHNFKEAARDLVNKADTDTDFHQQLNKMASLEELVAEHEDALNAMGERLKEKEAEILILSKKLQQTIQQKDKEKEDLLQQHGDYVNVNCAENEKMTAKIKDQAKEIEILKEEISAVKEANSRSPSANMKRLVEQLRNQLSLKESQNESLGKALAKIRAEMVEQAEETLKAHQDEKKQERNVQTLIEKHTEGLNEQIETLQVQNERLKNDVKKKRLKEQDLESQLEEAQEEITKKNNTLQKLKTEKEKFQFQVEELEKRNNRMKSTFFKSSDGESSELNEMRRRIRFLEDQVQHKQEQAEKPYEQSKAEKPKNVELIKWEERKKWEKTIEKLKNKVKGTENEVEKFEKEVKQLKIALHRSREKELLEARLKVPSKTPNFPPSMTRSANVGQDFQLRRELQDLKDINFQQTEELSRLKRQLSKDKDQIVKELAEENKYLVKEVGELKKAVKAKFAKEKESQICTEYQAVFEKNQDLQKELLQLSKENIEIHFEMEQAKKEVPRLKARVEDLQTYVDALKEENNRLDGDRAGIKKVGESGKSPKELEKIIALLKKVIDRVQAENEKLKKLAVKVDQTEQKVEKQEKKNFTSHEKQIKNEKGNAKLSADHEQLRKNFQKESEMRKKLENQLMEANEKLKKRLVGGSTTLDKENVEKIRNLEEELEKKCQILGDLKKLLRESAEREQGLLQEKQELLKQIEILKDFPMQSLSSESKLTKNYQLIRLKMNQLEKEKAQLLSEVEILQRKVHGRTSESTQGMLEKARDYDSLKGCNVELQLELKKIKFENEKIKKELDNFGPEFFEEIEQLKHSYKESVKKNLLYEDQLKSLGEKFGIHVKIPGS